MKRTLCTLIVAATASAAFGEICVKAIPNESLEGFTTYRVTLWGADLGFNAATIRFETLDGDQLNQVLDYGPYVFLNPTFDNLFPELGAEDSFFLFEQPNLLVSASESSTHLEASFAFDEPVTDIFPIAQLVLPDTVETLPLTIDLAYPGGTEVITVFDGNYWYTECPTPPEPSSSVLFLLASFGALRRTS